MRLTGIFFHSQYDVMLNNLQIMIVWVSDRHCEHFYIVEDLIVDRDTDTFALTETWLTSSDLDSQIVCDICPTGNEPHSMPRGCLGGSVVLVYKKPLRFQKQSCISTKFKSVILLSL